MMLDLHKMVVGGEATYRSVVHRLACHGQDGGEREDDADEQRPEDAVQVRKPADEAVAHVERPGHELDLGVVPVPPPAVGRRRRSVSTPFHSEQYPQKEKTHQMIGIT